MSANLLPMPEGVVTGPVMAETQTPTEQETGTDARVPRWRGAASVAVFVLVATVVVASFRFTVGGVPDTDSYYHLRHAAVYAEQGIWLREFPWLTHSLISRFASDMGYGFHLLLVPFTGLADPILGVQWSSIFAAVLALTCFFLAVRRHRLPSPAAWPFMLFFLGPPIVYTFMQTRPQTLTMGFGALLLSFLVTGSPWGALAAAFAISFTHLNVGLLVPVVATVAYGARGLSERRWEMRPAGFALGGMVLGWLARPNPLGALRIEYVQTIVHSLVRKQGVPLLFGREWSPITVGDAISYFPYFLSCWVGLAVLALALLALRKVEAPRPLRSLLWSSLTLSVLSFGLTVLNTKRGTPLWGAFGVMSVAAACAVFIDPRNYRSASAGESGRLLTKLALGFLGALMIWEGVNQFMVQRQWAAPPRSRLQAAAIAIAKDSRPGDIVYNTDWSFFPELFFWNTKNRYVSGLDPIFLYAFDQGLYWKTHHLQAGDTAGYTCPTPHCGGGKREDTYRVLTQDFGARYVVLDQERWPALYAYLKGRAGVTEISNEQGEVALRLGGR